MEYYRNESWNDEIEADFFTRLGRARSQRDQNLSIQIGTLASIEPKVAIRLSEFYFETRKDDAWDEIVQAHTAKALTCVGDLTGAMTLYRDLVTDGIDKPFFPTWIIDEVPYLIGKKCLSEYYELAYEYCFLFEDYAARSIVFPIQAYRINAAQAFIECDLGHLRLASEFATAAIEATSIEKTGLRYHQDIGLAVEVDADTLGRLNDIVRASPKLFVFANP